MKLKLKPLNEQVVVITGATSGIGLSTARAAAQRGAKLLLVARNGEALKAVCEDLHSKGAKAEYAVADVGDQSQVRAVVQVAIDRFGGFDTWVNNAGVSIFGQITQTPVEDQRRLMETNYWGVVYGSLAAVEHFKTRPGGGTLINIGSMLSDLAVPLKGPYSASKHAVKAFTNALRMEMLEQKAPVSVTLIKPSAVDTPYKDHARNLTGAPVRNPPPVYATPLVAQAILYAAEHRTRELTVGAGGRVIASFAEHMPLLAEPLLAWLTPTFNRDKAGRRRVGGDNLHQPGKDLRERAFYKDVRETSLYAAAQMRPKATIAIAVLAGVAAGLAFGLGRQRTRTLIVTKPKELARAAGAAARRRADLKPPARTA